MKKYNKRMAALLFSILFLFNTCWAGIVSSAEEIVNFVQERTYNYASNSDIYASGSDIYASGSDIYASGSDIYASGSDIYASDTDMTGVISGTFNVYASSSDYNGCISWSLDFSKKMLSISGEGSLGGNSYSAWKSYLSYIEVIEISEGITSIDYRQFYSHYYLKEIFLPNSLVTISSYAFDGCYNLKTINFTGDMSKWNDISISSYGNSYLLNAEMIYLCQCGGKFDNTVITKQPTCINYGEKIISCNKCDTKIFRNLELTDHNIVNNVCTICNASLKNFYIESDHPYTNNLDRSWTIDEPDTTEIKLIFSSTTEFENSYDKLYIYDSDDNIYATYTGSQLSNKTIIIRDNKVRLRLKTDGSVTRYGFRVQVVVTHFKGTEAESKKDFDYKIYDSQGEKYIEILKYIGNETSLNIPKYIDGIPVKKINTQAFYNSAIFTSITIPNTVTSISYFAFQNCSSIKNVHYCGTKEQWDKILINIGNTYLKSVTRTYRTYGEWKEIIEPTCSANGKKSSICSICGGEEIAEIEINPDNHNYTSSGECEWCNSFIESKHNYLEQTDETWVITKENVANVIITFSADTFVEKDWDFIYIYDGKDNEIGKYTGDQLKLKTVIVPGNTAKIRLYSDKINTAYGFKVINIAFKCFHNDYKIEIKRPTCIDEGYTIHTCKVCGYSYIDSYTEATGVHVYENGNCFGCNKYLESEHNYTDLFDKTWTIYREGAESITLTFSPETFVEDRYDFIYIYDANDNEIGKYTGGELASKSVTVSGNTAKIRLYSDRIYSAYGFKLTDITTSYYIGDLNGDGSVNVLDFVRLKKILVETTESDGASPDIDNNGTTNSVDLTLLKKFVLGFIKEF